MGTVIKTVDRQYNKAAKSWYDSTFKLLFPIDGSNVTFYSSYFNGRAAYKEGVNLSGDVIKFKVALANNLGTELTKGQIFSAVDNTNKIKLDVFLNKESASSFNSILTIVYSTESAVTTFTYTMLFATALESVYRVLEVNIDTVGLTASGTHYQRYSSTQPITSFDMSKSTSTGKVFNGTQNIIAMGTDSESIRIPSSAYPRIFAILVEIDDRAIFSTKLELYSAKGSYIDYSTNTIMNYIGVSTTNSKVSAALSACNIHN